MKGVKLMLTALLLTTSICLAQPNTAKDIRFNILILPICLESTQQDITTNDYAFIDSDGFELITYLRENSFDLNDCDKPIEYEQRNRILSQYFNDLEKSGIGVGKQRSRGAQFDCEKKIGEDENRAWPICRYCNSSQTRQELVIEHFQDSFKLDYIVTSKITKERILKYDLYEILEYNGFSKRIRLYSREINLDVAENANRIIPYEIGDAIRSFICLPQEERIRKSAEALSMQKKELCETFIDDLSLIPKFQSIVEELKKKYCSFPLIVKIIRPNVSHPLQQERIITKKELRLSPYQHLGDFLHYNLPMFYHVQQNAAGATDHLIPSGLRGGQPDQMIVLLNGIDITKNSWLHHEESFGRANSGYDFKRIPLNTIQEIKIYGPEAGIIFGKQSATGIINIITDNTKASIDNYFRAELELGAPLKRAGLRFNNVNNIRLVTDWFVRNGQLVLNGYFNTYHEGYINSSGNFNDSMAIASLPDTIWKNTGFSERKVMNIGKPLGLLHILTGSNIRKNITKNISLFFYGNYSKRLSESTALYRFPYDSRLLAQTKENGNVKPASPSGYSPKIKANIEDISATIGTDMKLWGSDIQLSYSYFHNNSKWNVSNTQNASFRYNEDSTSLYSSFKSGKTVNRTHRLILNLEYEFLKNKPELVKVYTGGEINSQTFKIGLGDSLSYKFMGMQNQMSGAQGFMGFFPRDIVDVTLGSIETYAIIEGSFFKRLVDFSLGGRFFSRKNPNQFFSNQDTLSNRNIGFINNISLKISPQRWQNVSFHTTAGKETKLPSLQQTFFTRRYLDITNGIQNIRIYRYGQITDSPLNYPINSLEREDYTYLSAGLSVKKRNISGKLDIYFIDSKNQIFLTDRLFHKKTGAVNNYHQFLLNGLNSISWGTDAQINLELNRGGNKIPLSAILRLHFANTRIEKDSIDIPLSEERELEIIKSYDTTLITRRQLSFIESYQPSWRISTTLLGTKEGGNDSWFEEILFSTTGSLFGSLNYINFEDNNPNKPKMKPRFILDFVAKGNIYLTQNMNLSLTIGANNALNAYPSKNINLGKKQNSVFVFNRHTQQFGITGGYYFIRLGLCF